MACAATGNEQRAMTIPGRASLAAGHFIAVVGGLLSSARTRSLVPGQVAYCAHGSHRPGAEVARVLLHPRPRGAGLTLRGARAAHLAELRVSRPETGGQIVGKAALREWWADAFRRLPQLRYVERTLTSDGQRVWMEYDRKAPGEPDLPVAEVLVVREGLIVESRVYHG